MSEEFLRALEEILKADDVPQETINKIAIALALDAQNNLSRYKVESAVALSEIRALIQAQSDNIDKLTAVVQRQETYMQTHPTLLYMIRFRTKETITVILFVFLLLSVLWVPEVRRPMLAFLGF